MPTRLLASYTIPPPSPHQIKNVIPAIGANYARPAALRKGEEVPTK